MDSQLKSENFKYFTEDSKLTYEHNVTGPILKFKANKL